MIHDDINREYFEWLRSLIRDSKPIERVSYKKLLLFLHNTEFMYIIPMDGNRCADGVNLRYRFGRERGVEDPVIASCLDFPCSVLEMMVALAVRVEEGIMFNPEDGTKSGRWFWKMISNLGLADAHDSKFNEDLVSSIIWRFMGRNYSPDGQGNIIYLPDCPDDLRGIEIWYQMMRYLSEYHEQQKRNPNG